MFAIALQVPLRAVKIRQLPLMLAPPQRQVNIKLLPAWLAYETLAVIAAILPSNQNASGAIGNCCRAINAVYVGWNELNQLAVSTRWYACTVFSDKRVTRRQLGGFYGQIEHR